MIMRMVNNYIASLTNHCILETVIIRFRPDEIGLKLIASGEAYCSKGKQHSASAVKEINAISSYKRAFVFIR